MDYYNYNYNYNYFDLLQQYDSVPIDKNGCKLQQGLFIELF